MGITILYEDADFLVINKPSGLVVHADGKTVEPTLVDWIMERAGAVSSEEAERIKRVGEPLVLSNGQTIFRPGIVHRIDRDTSGALLVAKNQPAYEHAKRQFQERAVRKAYHAFVYGEMRLPIGAKGKIDRPIARSKNDFRKWTAERGSRGEERQAITEYTVLAKGHGYTYVEARPLTGRTHQIRVHFKSANHPVVCDKLYAPNRECPIELGRLALHALSIEFILMNGAQKTVQAPLPPEFTKMRANLA